MIQWSMKYCKTKRENNNVPFCNELENNRAAELRSMKPELLNTKIKAMSDSNNYFNLLQEKKYLLNGIILYKNGNKK